MELSDFCQSCGMPLKGNKELMGTNKDGSLTEEYCQYCFKDGQFVVEKITIDEMIEVCVPHMIAANKNMTEDEARKQMKEFFPLLKRWRKA